MRYGEPTVVARLALEVMDAVRRGALDIGAAVTGALIARRLLRSQPAPATA
jgi:hypothetical protein